MIQSFNNKETAKIWNQEYSKKYPRDIQKFGLRKLFMIHRAKNLDDLRIPPSNNLEKLSGNRRDQYSIRINKKWRVCFKWREGEATCVEIIDYH